MSVLLDSAILADFARTGRQFRYKSHFVSHVLAVASVQALAHCQKSIDEQEEAAPGVVIGSGTTAFSEISKE